MKNWISTILLAGLVSSCAVSEDKAGMIGAAGGAVGGGFIGHQIDKRHGTGIKGKLFGAGVGAALGDYIGRESSSLDGVKRTELED